MNETPTQKNTHHPVVDESENMLQTTAAKEKKKDKKKRKSKKIHGNFSDCVTHAVEKYFSNLDQAPTSDFYDLFIREAEAPLLRVVMKHTDDNQSAAAQILGLSRGTLRKKLKDYDLL